MPCLATRPVSAPILPLRLMVTAIAAMAAGCLTEATEVLVIIDSNAPLDRVTTVSATVQGAVPSSPMPHVWVRHPGTPGSFQLPASFAVVPAAGQARDEAIELELQLSVPPGAGGEPASQFVRDARFRFTPSRTTVVRIFLPIECGALTTGCTSSAAACTVAELCAERGTTCGDNASCVASSVTTVPLDHDDASTADAPRPDVITPASDADLDATHDASSTDAADVQCAAGQHLCGASCVSDTSAAACGAACTSCPSPMNATATCAAGVCGFVCTAGWSDCDSVVANGCEAQLGTAMHCANCASQCTGSTPLCGGSGGGHSCMANCGALTACGASCADLTIDANHCGACGMTCPAVPNASATCAASTCGFTCIAGYHLCAGACVSDVSTATCGAACTPCVPPANATATCDGTACGFACDAGFHACGGACASNASVAACGASCTACAAHANATATCNGTACGFACNAGYTDCGGTCVNLATDASHCGSCGNACLSRACRGSVCVGYGGVYASSSTACAYCNADPLSGGCGCPSGTYPVLQSFLTYDDCGAAHNPAVAYVCASPALDAAAFGGAYEVDDPVGCGVGCLANNPYTGGCSCPAGTSNTTIRAVHNTSCGTIGARIHFCNPPTASSSYGGVYQVDDAVTGGLGCRAANVYTGGCSCPAGYASSAVRVLVDIPGAVIGSNLYQCTR